MKVVHIESGLGNQMLSYCEYLAIKRMNPYDDCYIETLVYLFEECNDFICQWNGYELDRVFNINAPNICSTISANHMNELLELIKTSKFWNRCWNWPVYFTEAFSGIGLELKNFRGNFESKDVVSNNVTNQASVKYKVKNSYLYLYFKYLYQKLKYKNLINSLNYTKEIFITTNDDILTGQRLTFKNRNSGIERIENEIRESFIFPPITDDTNKNVCKLIQSANSVAIHARRGDMLSINGYCYKNGYFRRAVKYIKDQVYNPVFIFFCDPGSIEWCKMNGKIFGLNFSKDKVYFVDWNKGSESFRDMQLMAECKHNIITNSSFGWWGAWLNSNPDKITCSPDYRINTTHTF